MLFTSILLPLLPLLTTYSTLSTALAFPNNNNEKDHKDHSKSCSALLSTKLKTSSITRRVYLTKTELSPYPSPSTSYIVTTSAFPYTTTYTSVGTSYLPVTQMYTVITVTATKTNREIVTKETKVPVTRMEVETKTACSKF